MLKLSNITKNYKSGDETVKALKGINLEFRSNEFVSILGPSGCGKTTLLNIIGGLDRYTSGDLIINGKSTKEFKDRDWDAYRNYSVGFVFQNYNLIPHQSVLSNVELAITLSGVSREERKRRSIEALEKVGLKEQIHKKPNQLSGGQMQRVAIARALVNDPDIILADEPTGALDTKTSIQIMELLKSISKDKLIIMVTHNPTLAEQYSTRVISVLDGVVQDDTNPYNGEKEKKRKAKTGKTSMSFFTAIALSLNNLMTKKGRTILTSFAGSIGIIGIALILSLSTGVQNYINKIQEDTLSSYPIQIQETTVDLTSMMERMMEETTKTTEENEEDKIYSNNIMTDMLTVLADKKQTNNLEELKKYIDEGNNGITSNSNAIKYDYNLNLNLYKTDTSAGVVQVNPSTVLEKIGMQQSGMAMGTDCFTELLDNQDLNNSQYEVVTGNWPQNYNEVVLIVDENNKISDYTLYTLGIKDQKELEDKIYAIQNDETIEEDEQTSYTYDDLLNLSFKVLLNTDYYEKSNNMWIDKSDDETYMKEKVDSAEEIKIVGIVKQKEGSIATKTSGEIGYLKTLKEYVINKINEEEIVKEQKENPEVNVFNGLEFPKQGESGKFDYNSLTAEQKTMLSKLDASQIQLMMEAYEQNENASYKTNLETLGVVDLEKPSAISIYPIDFEAKNRITEAITEYNNKQIEAGKEENEVNYTDTVGLMMKSVTQIVDTVSYVLIAFVAISLVVSSIMIGIITYISVLERTKEIGILRAIGASKKDISRVFNAETFIVGLIAGVLGIGVTLLLNIPINSVIHSLTKMNTVNAVLPVNAAIILVVISMVLTIIAGLIPSKMASKKDPVEALRTE